METLPNLTKFVNLSQKPHKPTILRHSSAEGSQVDLDLSAPRLCNTGAQIPAPSRTVKVDWVEFTVKGASPQDSVSEYLRLKFSDFTLADYGMQGYTDCYVYGSVKVLHSKEKPDRGTKIILSATALDEVGRESLGIMKLVLRDGGTFARIDIALDDQSGGLSIDRFWKAELAGQSVCHFREVSPIKKYNRHTQKLSANGVNYGSRCSSRYVRIYDKQLEQLNKKQDDPGPWIRCELEAKKRAALILAIALVNGGLESIPGIFAGALDYRNTSENEKTSRCERLPWWSAFLGDVQIIKTGMKKAITTIENKLEWLSRQCKKTLGQVAVGFNVEILRDLIEQGIKSTSKSEWEMLGLDRDSFNFSDLRKKDFQPCPF